MELSSLKNIAKEMQIKLQAVDVPDVETLKSLGSKEAFFRLKMKFPEVCLVHLYALEGAISDEAYNTLSEDTKKELKEFSDSI